MRPSTEKLLRQKLQMDMAETNFHLGIFKFIVFVFGGLFVLVCIVKPLTEGRNPFNPAPQAQQHPHQQHHKGSQQK